MNNLVVYVFIYVVIVISAVVHEFAHGWVAWRLGDTTAKDEGRLTLNPLAHIDVFGTVIVPIISLLLGGVFLGWAKPVPYNPFALSDRRWGTLKVGVAGPASNFIVALILGLLLRGVVSGIIPVTAAAAELLGFVVYVNIFLALFNLIPLPPLDGSKVLGSLVPGFYRSLAYMSAWGLFAALLIAFYVLPPLARLLYLLITGAPA
jgi:Zn-dependent protease